MRSRWASAKTNEPAVLRRTRGAVALSAQQGGGHAQQPRLRDFCTCSPTVAAVTAMLFSTAVLLVLCPMLHRARISKLAARRATPSYSFEYMLRGDECTQVVEQVKALNLFVDGRTGGRGGHSVRRSTVARLSRSEFGWVYERVQAGIALANSHAWGYSSLGNLEDLQVARYQTHAEGSGGHYTWHTDAIKEGTNYYAKFHGGPKNGWNDQNQNRLLSMSVQLSNGSEYIGGNLQVGSANATRKMGSAVVFPSYMLHRVHPVQEGERFALVAWLRGEDATGRYWTDAERSYRALSETEPAAQQLLERFLAESNGHEG